MPTSPALIWPFQLEYASAWMVLLAWAALAVPTLWLGVRSLAGLGPVRKWVAIGVRLAVLLLVVLILGGLRWQRVHKSLDVMVIRDISDSTDQVKVPPGQSLQATLDDYLLKVSDPRYKLPDDRIGVISFSRSATIDALPATRLELTARGIRERGNGTDIAAGIQLALASMGREAMHRLVLISDGNSNMGDLDAAVTAAASQGVQIDVMPLTYHIDNALLMDHFVAPAWKRENEPFTLDIVLRSTNTRPMTGRLSVTHNNMPLNLDPTSAQISPTRIITLQPGLNVEHVRVPPLEAGIHRFHATVDIPNVVATADQVYTANNSADAFTYVRGKGQVLYVDNVPDGRGRLLELALAGEGINVKRVAIDGVPNDVMSFENYDAVILANVPRGAGGLTEDQQKMIASYVHDMGGGLVMIGGEDSFGAGGWQGSKLEEVLPVNMDIPAQREMPKGALVLIMHSCEMPDGNYWGEQCALKAAETLSEHDDIGVISYGWTGRRGGGSQWDFPLQEKGDGQRLTAAIKNMKLGDMPSFDDAMNVALNGLGTNKGIKDSDARQKHVIIISDGDPTAPAPSIYEQYAAARVTVSTVSVDPHSGTWPALAEIAERCKGRAYGPINANFSQLPQIFIKEATVVRRSLIHEDGKGIPLKLPPSTSDMIKGLSDFPPVTGLVLTSRKASPQVEVPIVAGKNNDPVLAHWQTGLGKAAAFTSDAHNKWAAQWVASSMFPKFWAQVVRGVTRPPMSSDFDIQTDLQGDRGKISVDAVDKDNGMLDFANVQGQILDPELKTHDIHLVQTGPGTYTADFSAAQPGSYVVSLDYQGPKGEAGHLVAGVAVNSSPERRDLRSNDAVLQQIADRTGGRMLDPFDAAGADLFRRDPGLKITASPMPVWDELIPILLGLILVDVATRRIAWDWLATKRLAALAAQHVHDFTLSRRVETRQSLDALKRVRQDAATTQAAQGAMAPPVSTPPSAPAPRPDPKARFQAQGVEGDISQVVGGAVDKPVPPSPKKVEPKGAPPSTPGAHTHSLLEAKRRAQQKMKEQGGE